ncbi:uncharacterized protein LOC144061063 [Vanacampus margaritifer]
MRTLLDSSWTKFGPAGRDSLDWSSGTSADAQTDAQQQSSGGETRASSWGPAAAVALVTVLLFLSLAGVALWRRRRGLALVGGKLGLGDVIALEDLQDPERKCRLLSSLRREGRRLPSSASDDGVFLMVYLPSPYEGALSRIARAASAGSADDVGSPPSPRLHCPAPAGSSC